jgi:hypothetical protein
MRRLKCRFKVTRLLTAALPLLLILLCYEIQGATGAEHYSFFKQNNASIHVPLVVLEGGTVGSNTIFANSTSARTLMSSPANWWNPDYAYRQRLTIINNNLTTSITSMFTLSLTVDTQALVLVGKLRPDGNDFRIVWWNSSSSSWIQIDRLNMTNFNTSSTTIRFAAQKSIPPGGTDNDYYVYYGNSNAAAAPSDGRNVYLFEDLFNRAASSTVGYGWLEYETGGSDVRIAPNPLVSTNVLDFYSSNNPMDSIAVHTIQGLNSTGKCTWEFGFVWDRDSAENTYEVYMQIGNGSMTSTSPWLGVGAFLSWTGTSAATTGRAATAHEMLRVFDDDQIPTEAEVVSGGANITVELDFSSGNLTLFRNGVNKGSYHFYQRLLTYDRIRFVSDQVTPTNIVKRGFDYTRVYLTIDPSPSLSLSSEEAAKRSYDYVLKIYSTVTNPLQIRLKKYSESNINRLLECTLYFHNSSDGNSDQIRIQNGTYTQTTGNWYNLAPSQSIFIAVWARVNSTSLTNIYTYLEVEAPNTTTYTQYIIEFDIN